MKSNLDRIAWSDELQRIGDMYRAAMQGYFSEPELMMYMAQTKNLEDRASEIAKSHGRRIDD